MYKKFNWLGAFFLSLITCQIYKLYVFYKISKQQNDMAAKVGVPQRMKLIFVILLGFVTLGIFPAVWIYLLCRQQIALADAKGVELTPARNALLRFLLLLVPMYGLYVLCTNHNRLAQAFSEG